MLFDVDVHGHAVSLRTCCGSRATWTSINTQIFPKIGIMCILDQAWVAASYVYVGMYGCVYVIACAYVFTCVGTYECVRVRIGVGMYVRMCVSIYMCM